MEIRLNDGITNVTPDVIELVKEIQTLLNDFGIPTQIDGKFGIQTMNNVKRFQRENGFLQTGIVDENTYSKLKNQPFIKKSESYYSDNDRMLLEDLNNATPYLNIVNNIATKYSFEPSLIIALISRESNWGYGSDCRPKGVECTGDWSPRNVTRPWRPGPMPPDGLGFGRGLAQIDFDAHNFARSEDWKDPLKNIDYCCLVLQQNVRYLTSKNIAIGDFLLECAISAYNCGCGNVMKAIQLGKSSDYFTAHRNYASDVLERKYWFDNKI